MILLPESPRWLIKTKKMPSMLSPVSSPFLQIIPRSRPNSTKSEPPSSTRNHRASLLTSIASAPPIKFFSVLSLVSSSSRGNNSPASTSSSTTVPRFSITPVFPTLFWSSSLSAQPMSSRLSPACGVSRGLVVGGCSWSVPWACAFASYWSPSLVSRSRPRTSPDKRF